METGRVRLTGAQETLLATLYARALESRSSDPILRDPLAEEAIDQIDYDFERLKVDTIAIAMRARQFDLWTAEFLADHPDAIVLHLGCGLDSRVFRLNPGPRVRWLDVDFREVIELRGRLYPGRAGYEMVGASLADLQWMDGLPADRPAWVLLEGVSMYLSPEVMSAVLRKVTTHFRRGAVAFDVLSRAATRMAGLNPSLRRLGVRFGGFCVDDPDELAQVVPRLQLVRAPRIAEMPGSSKQPLAMRAAARVVDFVPGLRKLSRILLFQFPPEER